MPTFLVNAMSYKIHFNYIESPQFSHICAIKIWCRYTITWFRVQFWKNEHEWYFQSYEKLFWKFANSELAASFWYRRRVTFGCSKRRKWQRKTRNDRPKKLSCKENKNKPRPSRKILNKRRMIRTIQAGTLARRLCFELVSTMSKVNGGKALV